MDFSSLSAVRLNGIKDVNYLFCIFISKLVSYHSLPDNLALHPCRRFWWPCGEVVEAPCFYKFSSFHLERPLLFFISWRAFSPSLKLQFTKWIWLLFILQDAVCTHFLYNIYQNILQFFVSILSFLEGWIWKKSVSLSLYLWYPASMTLKIIKNLWWINEWLNYVRKIILVHGIQSILEPGNLIV